MWRFLVVLLLVVSSKVAAHGGEDHADAAPVLANGPALQRATAQSGVVEAVLVATPKSSNLTLYLAEQLSNMPLRDAEVDVMGLSLSSPVQMVAPGHYQLNLAKPLGSEAQVLALTVSAQTSSGAILELLDLQLPAQAVSSNETVHDHVVHDHAVQWPLWFSALLGLCAGALITWVFGRRQGA